MTVIDRFGRPKETPTGYVLQPGESLFSDLGSMHLPANTRRMGDTALAAFFRDGGMGGSKADDVPAGFFKDAYGRLLPTGTTSGNAHADGKALGTRLIYEQNLRDAYKAGDAEPADTSVNTVGFIQKDDPSGEVPDATAVRKKYEVDLTNAWRQPDPELPERAPVAYGGKRRVPA